MADNDTEKAAGKTSIGTEPKVRVTDKVYNELDTIQRNYRRNTGKEPPAQKLYIERVWERSKLIADPADLSPTAGHTEWVERFVLFLETGDPSIINSVKNILIRFTAASIAADLKENEPAPSLSVVPKQSEQRNPNVGQSSGNADGTEGDLRAKVPELEQKTSRKSKPRRNPRSGGSN